jgi:putative PIG3 family NAD(P)H quinone oxidoreductase
MERVRAVCIREPGGLEVLELVERSCRPPGYGEVLVAVEAAGLNRADLLQRRGLYPAPAGCVSDVPGLEFAGTVSRLGEGVDGVAVGDRVMGIVGGGAMSEALVVHHRELIPVPSGMPMEEAAAVPEAFLTAWDALFGQAGVGMGDTVLLHAVASGVGTAAVQLCRAAGVRSIGTSRSASKLAVLSSLGLDDGFVPSEDGFADRVLACTDGRGVDVVLDPVGARYLADNLRALAPLGRLVLIGALGGARAELPLGLVIARRLRLMGTVLRSRSFEEKATLAREFTRALLPLFARGTLRPVIDRVFPMEEIRAAHARMERNETVGKIVLRW